MNAEGLNKIYALNDGEILLLNVDYQNRKIGLTLLIRKYLSQQKLESCVIELEFVEVYEINLIEDFGTVNYSDVVLIELDNKDFYLSLDPYGNSGLPHEKDNFIIKAKNLTLIDENQVRQSIR